MERPLYKPVGTPVEQLDTPALVVDLTLLEHNLERVHAVFRQHAIKLRPHVSTHRCPILAHQQLAAGGTVGGISVTTLGEAQVFAAHGFDDIAIAQAIVTPSKMAQLCALAHRLRLTVAVDHVPNVQALAAVAASHGVSLQVAVEMRTQEQRRGVGSAADAVTLARSICQSPALAIAGLSTTINAMPRETPETLATTVQKAAQLLFDTKSLLVQEGMAVPMVSVGGMVPYDRLDHLGGVTEIRTGTYALMEAASVRYFPELRPAARVLSSISSRPEAGVAISDAGQKAIGVDTGLPVVSDFPGVVAQRLSAEHCRLDLDQHADATLGLGDKIWLTPWDIATCANLYDYLHGVRHGGLEGIWSIAARGQYR